MCGIIGCAGNLSAPEEQMFQTMLQLDTIRGPHSTGVLAVEKFKDNWSSLKVVGTPWDLFAEPEYKKIMTPGLKVLLGHNRWATRGKVSENNAHPFNHKHIIGVHNGTLHTTHNLDDNLKFEVDSDNIFFDMHKNGYEKTIPKLNGAYALVWWNDDDSTLNIIRNKDRTLYIAHSKDSKCVFWASEAWMLEVGAMKHGVQLLKPYLAQEDTLFQFLVGDKGALAVTQNSGKKIEGYKYVPAVNTSTNTKTTNDFGYKSENLVFEVIDEVFSAKGSFMYTRGEVVEGKNKGAEVRIYAGKHDMRKKLMESMKFWCGDVSWSVTEGKHRAFVMKAHTCVEFEFYDDEDDEFVDDAIEVGGKTYSRQALFSRVIQQHGCAWCGDVGTVEKVHKFVWNKSGTECLCHACADTNALQYFHEAG